MLVKAPHLQAKPAIGPDICEECGAALQFLPTAILTTALPHYRCPECKIVWIAWGAKILGRCEDPADHQRAIDLVEQEAIIFHAQKPRAAVHSAIPKHLQNSVYCKRWYRKHRGARLAKLKADREAKFAQSQKKAKQAKGVPLPVNFHN